jgi:hypothetical protein
MTVRSIALISAFAGALASSTALAQLTYRRAELERGGQLRLTTSTGRAIRPPKDSDQVAFAQIAISPDRQAVGWLALYPNCCTTYPVPLKLVVLMAGTARTFGDNELPIWRWSFSANGRRVAFVQAPAHGAGIGHYELRDIRSGREVSSFDAIPDTSDAPVGLPRWARVLKRTPPAQ